MSELADNTGKTVNSIELAGETIPLGALKLNDLVEFEQQVGPLAMKSDSAEGLRYLLFLAARRGGSQSSLEGLGEKIDVTDLLELNEKLGELIPTGEAPKAKAAPEAGTPSSGA